MRKRRRKRRGMCWRVMGLTGRVGINARLFGDNRATRWRRGAGSAGSFNWRLAVLLQIFNTCHFHRFQVTPAFIDRFPSLSDEHFNDCGRIARFRLFSSIATVRPSIRYECRRLVNLGRQVHRSRFVEPCGGEARIRLIQSRSNVEKLMSLGRMPEGSNRAIPYRKSDAMLGSRTVSKDVRRRTWNSKNP